MARKTSDPLNSPYRSIGNSMSEYFKQWEQNLTHPSEIAKVILQAVTSDNPDFRYVVGKDARYGVRIKKKYVRQGISKLDQETDQSAEYTSAAITTISYTIESYKVLQILFYSCHLTTKTSIMKYEHIMSQWVAYADGTQLIPNGLSYDQAAPIFCVGY